MSSRYFLTKHKHRGRGVKRKREGYRERKKTDRERERERERDTEREKRDENGREGSSVLLFQNLNVYISKQKGNDKGFLYLYYY